MNTIKTRLNASGRTLFLRLLVFVSALVLASYGIVYGQNGKVRLEAVAPKNLRWRALGPAIVGGRIDDIAVVEGNASTFYVGVATGGVWKTTNAGTTFDPIFD